MGFQTGPIRIRGRVGNLIFSKTANGDEVRTNSSLNAERLKTDPKFARTRENWTEFTSAVSAGKLIRRTLAKYLTHIADSQSHSRLLAHTMRVVKSDATGHRGERRFNNGDLKYLTGYEFNNAQKLQSVLQTFFETDINRTAGTAQIHIPAFSTATALAKMPGATHFKIRSASATFDWLLQKGKAQFRESPYLTCNESLTPAQTVHFTFPPATPKTIILCLGVSFYQHVNGRFYQLSDKALNALAIVAAD